MTDESRTINQAMTLNMSLESVFKAFTDADEMMRWWPSQVESDPRTGGQFKFTFENNPADAPVHVREGAYVNMVENEQISYPWNIPGFPPVTMVEVNFSSAGDSTTVDLTHSGWPTGAETDEIFTMHDQGWAGFLQNLKIVMEGGEDIRPTAMDMKTAAVG